MTSKSPDEQGQYKGTGLDSQGKATLERTSDHEAGHSMNKRHPDDPSNQTSLPAGDKYWSGNIMHQTGQPNRGLKATEVQVIQIEADYNAGNLNQGQQN